MAGAAAEFIQESEHPPTLADIKKRIDKMERSHAAAREVTSPKRDDDCGICHDTGWVELEGRTRVGRAWYDRGMAPCKWCQTGARVYQALTTGADSDGRFVYPARVTESYEMREIAQEREPRDARGNDRALVALWAEYGYERQQDGYLYSLVTGERTNLMPPEEHLPPLPDGKRPSPTP